MAILTTLQSKKNVTFQSIAWKNDISARTVFRDLRARREIGVSISHDDQKGYSISQGFFLPFMTLTKHKANALQLVSTLSERFSDHSTKQFVDNAIREN